MIHERLRPKPEDLVGKIALKALDTANSAQTRKSGSVTIHNADGTKTISGAVLGTDETGTAISSANWVGDTTAPGKPIGVAAASSSGVVVAFWSGSLDGGVPSDFDHVTIYAKKDNETVILGKLLKEGSISSTALTVGETYEIYATAEDGATNEDGTAAHNVSDQSDAVNVTVDAAADPAAVEAAQQAADDAKSAAAAAQSTADAAKSAAATLSTLIRQSDSGIDVGKSADGSTYDTPVTRMGSDGAFHVLTKALVEVAKFGENVIELGKNSVSSVIKLCGGVGTITGSVGATRDILTISSGDIVLRGQEVDVEAVNVNFDASFVRVSGASVEVVPTVLYNGGAALNYNTAPGSGTTDTVTLSETAAHFRKMTIYGQYSTFYTSTTVCSPNDKRGLLQFVIPNAGPATMVYIKSKTCWISGTQITNSAWASMWLNASTNHFDTINPTEISIIRVEGWR